MTKMIRGEFTPQTYRLLIRACELAAHLRHDDPNDEWIYHDLAVELAEQYEAEQERLDTTPKRPGIEAEALDAACDELDRAARQYLWWETKIGWHELDPIGKSEFQSIVAQIVLAYLKKAKERLLADEIAWRGGIKAAHFAAAALDDWLSNKLIAWQDLDDPPDNWDHNDVPLFRIAIRELQRLGHHPGEMS
jgi:hypothetical protein